MAVGGTYSVGEKLLCFHGPLLYEAKCIQVKSDDNEIKYFIHYSGWNKNWDEWVSKDRILKYSEANLQKQKQLQEEHVTARKAKSRKKCDKPNEKPENVKKDPIKKKAPVKEEKRPSKRKPPDVEIKVEKESPEVVKKGSKNKRVNKEVKFVLPKKAKKVVAKKNIPKIPVVKDVEVKKNKAVKNIKKVKKVVKISTPIKLEVILPENLNDWMKDDNYMIKTYKKLLRLPARVTANDIIIEYERLKINVPDLPCASTKTISKGIRNYFNVILGKRLLYRFERIQYSDVLTRFKDIPLCDIYGAIHLLRMLKNVGTYIQENDPTLKNNEILTFQKCFDDFVAVTKDVFNDRLSLEDYETASPEYHRRSY